MSDTMKWEKINKELIELLKRDGYKTETRYHKPVAPKYEEFHNEYTGSLEHIHHFSDEEKYQIESNIDVEYFLNFKEEELLFELSINDNFLRFEKLEYNTMPEKEEGEDYKLDELFDDFFDNDDYINAPNQTLSSENTSKTPFEVRRERLESNHAKDFIFYLSKCLEEVALNNDIEVVGISTNIYQSEKTSNFGYRKATHIENGVCRYHINRHDFHLYYIKLISDKGRFNDLVNWHKSLLKIINDLRNENPTTNGYFGSGFNSFLGEFFFYYNGQKFTWLIRSSYDKIKITDRKEKILFIDDISGFSEEKLKNYFNDLCEQIDKTQINKPAPKEYFEKLMKHIYLDATTKKEIYQEIIKYYDPYDLEKRLALSIQNANLEGKPLIMTEARHDNGPIYYLRVVDVYLIIEEDETESTYKWVLLNTKKEALKEFQLLCEEELKRKLELANSI